MTASFEELWKFNIEGNYVKELERLSAGIDTARADWAALAAEFEASGASFATSRKEMAKLTKELGEAGKDASTLAPLMSELADSSVIQARASNQLAQEQNRLNVARAAELRVLKQTEAAADPQIIRMRAETAAIEKLTAEIQREAQVREFRRLAASAGLQVSADGSKLLNIEAEAAVIAAKAQERLALAEALRRKGLDLQGAPIPAPATQAGRLTDAGKKQAEQAAIDAAGKLSFENAKKEAQLLNKEFVESTKRAKELDKQFAALTGTAGKTDGVFNRISFTFRRLIGIMAAFTVARVVVSEFNSMITTAIKFQAQIEASRVGLAGLIAASAEIKGTHGENLGINEQLLKAQDIAIDQMVKLRKEALETAASYDELAAAFQSAVSPGLQSNLTLDQIRKITVSISQAATGLGLAQNQLAEEIRSLLQGTISARNTRIATALGISNEDIRRAKELGNLFEFLDTRFKAISLTGKLLMNTFTGQLSNATDAFKQLLAESSKPLFEQLKAGLRDVQTAIFTTIQDAVVFKPEALAGFRELFAGLANGVQAVRSAFASIDVKGFATVLGLIGQSLGLIASGLANAFTVAFNAAAPTLTLLKDLIGIVVKLGSAIQQISGPFGTIVGFLGNSVLKAVTFLFVSTRLLKIAGSLAKMWATVRAFIVGSTVATAASEVSLSRIQKITLLISTNFKRLLVWVLAVAAALEAIDLVLKLFGVDAGPFDLINAGLEKLSSGLDTALGKVSGLKEELAAQKELDLGIIVPDFRELKSDLKELEKSLTDAFRVAVDQFRQDITNIGIPPNIASQLQEIFSIEKDTFFGKEFEQLMREINRLQTALRELDNQKSLPQSIMDQNEGRALGEEISSITQQINKLREVRDQQAKDLKAQQKTFFEVGFKAFDDKDTRPFLDALNKTKSEIAGLEKQRSDLTAKRRLTDAENNKNDALKTATQEQLLGLLEEESRIRARVQKQVSLSVQTSARRDIFDTNTKIANLALEALDLQAQAAQVAQIDTLKAESARKQLAVLKAQVEAQNQISELERGITQLEEKRRQLSLQDDDFSKAAVKALDDQIGLRKEELLLTSGVASERLNLLKTEAKLAELRAKGTPVQGFAFGLQEFAQQNDSLFNMGEKFAQDFAQGISDFGATAVASIFDRSANKDLDAALGSLFLGLGQSLLSELFSFLLSQFIQSLGISVLGPAAGFAAGAAAAGSAFSDEVLLSALGFDTTVTITAGTFLKAVTDAAAIWAAAHATAGGVAGGARGGRASSLTQFHGRQGFARGGRPRGMDARDTIPAMLRPGEWVIRPEAVALYGDRLFDLLNRGILPAPSLRGIAGAGRSPSMPKSAKRSFATGGSVIKGAASPRRGQAVQVVQFFDEQTMSRAFAAGQESMVRFTRQKQSNMRAALGLEPGVN